MLLRRTLPAAMIALLGLTLTASVGARPDERGPFGRAPLRHHHPHSCDRDAARYRPDDPSRRATGYRLPSGEWPGGSGRRPARGRGNPGGGSVVAVGERDGLHDRQRCEGLPHVQEQQADEDLLRQGGNEDLHFLQRGGQGREALRDCWWAHHLQGAAEDVRQRRGGRGDRVGPHEPGVPGERHRRRRGDRRSIPEWGTGECSATVVSRTLLITAAHCIYSARAGGRATRILFVPGQTWAIPRTRSTSSCPSAGGRRTTGGTHRATHKVTWVWTWR